MRAGGAARARELGAVAAFALGRALKPQDEGLIRHLLADLKKADYRAEILVESIVLSEAFQTQGGSDH